MAKVDRDAPRHAGRLQPADRAADQRDGRRHPGRPRHQALRRRPGGPEGEGRRDRAGRRRRSRAPRTSTTEQITGPPGPPRRGRPARPSPATASRPRQVLDAVKAAGRHRRSARSIEPGRRFPLVVRLPMSYRDDPKALEKILIPTASGQTAPAHPARPPGRDDRPLDHPARVGRAADRRPGERPGPRHRLVRRGGPGADRPRGASSRPATPIEWGGQFENLERAERRLFIVVPLALALDPEPALPDVPLDPRRPDDLQRRALRPGRRRPRPLASWACRSRSRRASASSPWPGRRCSKG